MITVTFRTVDKKHLIQMDICAHFEGIPLQSYCVHVLKMDVTFTFKHQIKTNSSLSRSECLCKIWRNSLKAFLRYCIHKNGTNRGTDGRTQPENVMALALAAAGMEA